MKKIKLILTFIMVCFSLFAFSAADTNIKTSPTLNNGKKWRIAYCESAPYPNYSGTLYAILKGLEKLGWVNGVSNVPFKWGQFDTKGMWDAISKNKDFSSYLEFVPDAYYSLKDYTGKESQVIQRFNQKKDIDLVITMGTAAGKLLAIDNIGAKIMIFSTSNAYKSGIIKDINTSGRKQIWAHMDPNRYQQQLQVFHDIFKYKKLGMVYEDSPNGRVFAAINDVELVSKEKGFQIIAKKITLPKTTADQDRYFKDFLKINTELAKEVDAFYYTITGAPGLKQSHLYEVLKPLYLNNIPVFAQFGDDEVRLGALMSIARADFAEVGQFGSEQMAKVFNGAEIDTLPQLYSDVPTIAINLQVAKSIGFKPPFEILLVSDKIFRTVEIPEDKPVKK